MGRHNEVKITRFIESYMQSLTFEINLIFLPYYRARIASFHVGAEQERYLSRHQQQQRLIFSGFLHHAERTH